MEVWIVLAVAAAVVAFFVLQGRRRAKERAEQEQRDLETAKNAVGEDITKYGEELTRLDTDLLTRELDTAERQDYQRALDCYEQAKEALDSVTEADQIKHVTEVLEDGRYAVACVRARVDGEPLPQRRAPCFFNPAHGPSVTDVEWAPAGGQPREVPMCAADAERVRAGAEPDIRTVMNGPRRVPYWEGGRAYAPYAQGYFGGFAMGGLLPGLMIGSMLGGGFGEMGDMGGGDMGGGMGGGDMGGMGDMGGGMDMGGMDFGGFDF